MVDETDPLADFVARWRTIEVPSIDDPSMDDETRAVVDHLRRAYFHVPIPAVPIVLPRARFIARRVRAAAAVLVLGASIAAIALLSRPRAGSTDVDRPRSAAVATANGAHSAVEGQDAGGGPIPAVPTPAAAAPKVEVIASECTAERSVIRSGRVRLVMLIRPAVDAGGESQ